MKHKIVAASFDVHGTRSVQKLIQICHGQEDMLKDIMDALRGNIAKLSSDSNGNHVIQRCLNHMPEEYKVYVYEEVVKSCVNVGGAGKGTDRADLDATPRVLRGAALSGLRAREVPQYDARRDRELRGGAHL